MSEPDDLGELDCTATALRRAARRLGNLYDDAVAPTGLRATQAALLGQVDRLSATEGPSLQSLAEHLAIGVSSLTYALRPLVRDGLIELRPDAHDRRSKHAWLTPLGRTRLIEAKVLWAAANRRTDVVLGREAAHRLRALADQVSSPAFLEDYRRLDGV